MTRQAFTAAVLLAWESNDAYTLAYLARVLKNRNREINYGGESDY